MELLLDNIKLEAEKGESIITTATRNGINIPHFCWHPELSIGGNCRMCLVEVGTPKRNPDGTSAIDENGKTIIVFMPKLQIACNTFVSDGMVVNTNTQKCIDARKSVMEFILINHPLDCPICDEAGNCKLQHYSTLYSSPTGSRFCEIKNTNPKRVKWNEYILYDAERCISCGRCSRFTREIAQEDVLTFINRGDKVRINRFNDAPLTNAYSMNIIDNCPVGALTSNDFRFKARVWEMSFNDSICPGCSRGCNISIGMKNGEALRVQSVTNTQTYKHWICDTGRLQTPKYINDSRLTHPSVKSKDVKEPTLEFAIKAAVLKLRFMQADKTMIIVSPFTTNESINLVKQIAKHLKINNIHYIPRIDTKFGDNLMKRNEVSPNHFGCEAAGIKNITYADIAAEINSGNITNIFSIDEDFANEDTLAYSKLDSFIMLTAKNNDIVKLADVALSVTTFAEMDGTWTNCEGVEQHFTPAILNSNYISPIEALQMGIKQSRLDVFGADNDKWNKKEQRDIKPSEWILKQILNDIIN